MKLIVEYTSQVMCVQSPQCEPLPYSCLQLFTEGSQAIEVTQLSFSAADEDGNQPGPGPKRRRLESGWEAIRTFIDKAGQSPRLIPW